MKIRHSIDCEVTPEQVNLKEMGLNDYGDLESGDLHSCANNKMELFYNDEVSTSAPRINELILFSYSQ